MKEIRIRSIGKREESPWVYLQEKLKVTASKNEPFKVSALVVAQKKKWTNQYGMFRYKEKQYGKLEGELPSSLEISKTPMRIKNQNGEWIYFDSVLINGACPAIRIRNRNNQQTGPWVYIQHQEV